MNKQATLAYNNKDFITAAKLFKSAFDKDPLQCTFSLNTGLAYYEAKEYNKAIDYLELSVISKKNSIIEKSLRYNALALLQQNRRSEACAVFLKLKNTFPKRMYEQEFQKYCLGQNN